VTPDPGRGGATGAGGPVPNRGPDRRSGPVDVLVAALLGTMGR
jgi:hypothetical protein